MQRERLPMDTGTGAMNGAGTGAGTGLCGAIPIPPDRRHRRRPHRMQCDAHHLSRELPSRHVLGYGLTRPSDAKVVTGFELVTRT
jgi:hypothetical protein